MKGRLIALIVPASATGVALGVTAAGYKSGAISQGVFYWIWPALVAALFLSLAIGALVMRWTKWAWPPLVGFVVQLVGYLLLVVQSITEPLDILWYSVGAFLLAILLVCGVWLFVALRTRALEKKMLEGTGEGGVDAQQLATIRKSMSEALAMMRRAGRGRNAIYELPWLLVMGRPQGGKTFAIKKSGLSLPVRQDWVKGVGGTFTADWFFTNEIIFLDTPGKWAVEGVGEEGAKHWTELLRLLRRHRGRRPLDGVIVVVPADDLLSKSREELYEQASHIREVVDLIHDELKFRFPVYVIVSKTDLVEGFVDFFKGLPANRKHQVFGWSHPDPNDLQAVTSVGKAFRKVLRRMQAYRLEILARTASASAVRRLFFFTEEFRRLEAPLVEFVESLFQSDPFHETPVFRGIYFTSATQGEGAPLGQALAQLSRSLGIRTAPSQAASEEGKRSYFLLELFRDVVVGDEGLVSRTARHWLRRRRDTVLAAFLPAATGATILAFAILSFVLNRGVYRDAAVEIPRVVHGLEGNPDIVMNPLIALKGIDKIRDYHEKMTGFTLFRDLFMRRPGDLADETFQIFSDELHKLVLVPTFREASHIVMDSERNLSDRADALYSVVWLRQGHVNEYGDDLKGFERIWSALGPEDTSEARGLLVRQFAYLSNKGPRQTNLLREFDLAEAASAIADAAREAGSASALRTYFDFQADCSDAKSPNEYRDCNRQLSAALKFGESEISRLRANLRRLRSDLDEIKGSEEGAGAALAALNSIQLAGAGDSCSQLFDKEVVPSLRSYYLEDQKKLIDSCRQDYDRHGLGAGITRVINAQEEDAERKKLGESVGNHMATVNQADACRNMIDRRGELSAEPVLRLAPSYRRVECVREANESPVQIVKRKKAAKGSGGGRASVAPSSDVGAVVVPMEPAGGGGGGRAGGGAASLKYFTRSGVPGLDLPDWHAKKNDLSKRIEYASSLSGAEKSVEEQKIRMEIQYFASRYESTWKSYLTSIQVKHDVGASPGEWLGALASSGEWRAVLEPAARALEVDPQPADLLLGEFDRGLSGLSNVKRFLNADLGEYQALLDGLGADLKRCAKDSSVAAKYRAAYQDADASNSLVKAERWVLQHGGQSLAEGTLQGLLSKPLTIAKGALGESDDPVKQWDVLVAASQGLAGKFPFGGADATALVGVDELRLLLGGKSGYVNTMWGMQDKLGLGTGARAWLARAHDLSLAFFEAGSDEPRPYSLLLTLDDASVEILPAKIAEDGKWRLEALKFETGAVNFDWVVEKEKPRQQRLPLELIGDAASGMSKLVVTPAELDTGVVGIGKNKWKPQAPTVAASADGFWAPLQAIASLKGTKLDDGRVAVQVSAKIPYKKVGGTISVKLVAQGPKLATLLDLLSNPLPPAPAAGS